MREEGVKLLDKLQGYMGERERVQSAAFSKAPYPRATRAARATRATRATTQITTHITTHASHDAPHAAGSHGEDPAGEARRRDDRERV